MNSKTPKIGLFQSEEVSGAKVRERERQERFAPKAAERIRAAENCLFSVLPFKELARMAGEWYGACSEAMLRGNYSLIDTWVRQQLERAVNHGFAPEDLLKLLLICRHTAMEVDSWDKDIFCVVDEAIYEMLVLLNVKVPAPVPEKPKKEIEAPKAEIEKPVEVPIEEPVDKPPERTGERRKYSRNRLHLPIRITRSERGHAYDVTQTTSVSRGGLYFVTEREYRRDEPLKINFPYWDDPGAIQVEYPAKIIRIRRLPEGGLWGVGIEFEKGPD